MLLLGRTANVFPDSREESFGEEPDVQAERAGIREKISIRLKDVSRARGIKGNESIERRWNTEVVSWSGLSSESKTLFIVRAVLALFCLVVARDFFFGNIKDEPTSFLLYILSGQWERGFNIFAVSASIMIICIVFFLVRILDQVLYWIAKVSDTKTETVCHFLKSLIKYGAVIVGFYYCLALFGFETTAERAFNREIYEMLIRNGLLK